MTSSSSSTTTTTYHHHHQGFFPNDDNSNPQQGAAYHHHHHYYYQQQQQHQNQQQYQNRQDQSKSQRSTTTTTSNPNRGLSRDDRKLFVGGLPSNITSIEFETFFQQFGSLVDSVVMFDRDTHRSRGFGFVTYEDVSVCHKLLMMGNEESNPSNVMSLIGRIEMQGKICEIKAATPRELNGNRGFRRNHYNNTNNNNNTNHMTTQEEESKKTIPETASSSTAAPNNNNNKAVITPKATPSSFFPAMYPYPPNQGHPTHFPHPHAFYYPPSFPVYVPPHMEYPPFSGGYANPVQVGTYVENSFPNDWSDQTSLSQHPNTVTFGDKQQPNEPDASLASSKSPTPNTTTIDKGVLTPSYPPMIHTMGYPLVSATPTLLIPPIPPASQGSMPIPMTTTSAIPVVPEHIPYIPTSYGCMIPGAAAAPPPLSLPPHPPFHLPAASPHIFREGDTYPPPYPTASAVPMGPWEPVPYGVIPPPPPTNPAPTQSKETMG